MLPSNVSPNRNYHISSRCKDTFQECLTIKAKLYTALESRYKWNPLLRMKTLLQMGHKIFQE